MFLLRSKPIDRLCLFAVLALALPAAAQERTPLTAIDWLKASPHAAAQPVAQPAPGLLIEPPITPSGQPPSVSVAPLETPVQKRRGLLPGNVTGLPANIWVASDVGDLKRKLDVLSSPRLPATQSLLFTLLMAEVDDPARAKAAQNWLLARIDHLTALGAVAPARALALQSQPRKDKAVFARWMDLSLLTDNESAACTLLGEAPALSPDAATRIYCLAQQGDFDTAALLFGTAAAIGEITPREEALLARFLDPDLYPEDTLHRPPVRPDPLTFRLYEAVGAPLSTAAQPRSFAHAGLRPQIGWKAQLAAAERLARAGALPAAELIALYSDRKPAASGGIWDRVTAFQKFQKALRNKDTRAMADLLPPLWRSLRAAGIEVPVAGYFARSLVAHELPQPAARIAYKMQLLSPVYANAKPVAGLEFLHGLARAKPDAALARTDTERAIARAFAAPPHLAPPPGKLGESMLDLLIQLEQGAGGDSEALFQALSGMRALGMEDMATRAGLQILILRAPV